MRAIRASDERMRRYLVSLDLNNAADHAKLMGVYSDLLQDIARRASQFGSGADAYRDRWVQTLSAAGFEVDKETYVVSDPSRPTSLGLTADALAALTDPSAILDHLARLGDTVETDPRLAVSTAKALIESIAKSVLTARGVAYTKSDKVPGLVNRAPNSRSHSRRKASATKCRHCDRSSSRGVGKRRVTSGKWRDQSVAGVLTGLVGFLPMVDRSSAR